MRRTTHATGTTRSRGGAVASRVELTRALIAGRNAARANQPATVCPHPARTLARAAWIRGYAQVRPIATA
ncbi:Rmf/CrpP fold protein [Streptomyces antimycoticus]|uniref:Rmf/CrpP fold protein n=1 Tax=Streptomyces antimycoticus TaxID=68175 RepID=UPI003420D81C